MTPAQAIADLDAALARDGQTVKLQKIVAGALAKEASLRAFVRGMQPLPLVGANDQQMITFVISPTDIAGTAWPGFTVDGRDARVPVKGDDRIITANGPSNVQSATGLYMGDVLVRINGTALGYG
jgi:hypothetical protein